ncbi:hypothetical protein AVEN_213823-1 [Araneus ventricosus]|uniref:Uncharacterized protein n=1 Tax=Araneus ventricosus TaxID=182803 RepID=A0A4Y2NXW7_ARAVE|nr:hypothetical protein AVEN_213823-1 [Araneus ventricosus]
MACRMEYLSSVNMAGDYWYARDLNNPTTKNLLESSLVIVEGHLTFKPRLVTRSSQKYPKRIPSLNMQRGWDNILHEDYCRHHISFLLNVFTQKSEIPSTNHCANFSTKCGHCASFLTKCSHCASFR